MCLWDTCLPTDVPTGSTRSTRRHLGMDLACTGTTGYATSVPTRPQSTVPWVRSLHTQGRRALQDLDRSRGIKLAIPIPAPTVGCLCVIPATSGQTLGEVC